MRDGVGAPEAPRTPVADFMVRDVDEILPVQKLARIPLRSGEIIDPIQQVDDRPDIAPDRHDRAGGHRQILPFMPVAVDAAIAPADLDPVTLDGDASLDCAIASIGNHGQHVASEASMKQISTLEARVRDLEARLAAAAAALGRANPASRPDTPSLSTATVTEAGPQAREDAPARAQRSETAPMLGHAEPASVMSGPPGVAASPNADTNEPTESGARAALRDRATGTLHPLLEQGAREMIAFGLYPDMEALLNEAVFRLIESDYPAVQGGGGGTGRG